MINLQELNEAQQEAVTCIDAPSLVIAGAGSGKTRVLTYKIAYLLEHDFKPWNILALTFTNKAAREMQDRIGRQVDKQLANQLWMGTFHSIFSRILRYEAAQIGFTSNFTIYDASDSKSLVKSIIHELHLDEKVYKPSTVCNRISDAKNRLVFPNQYANDVAIQDRDNQQNMPLVSDIYLRYMQRCRLSDAMDFDDLLLYTYYLFHTHPDILKKYQEKFQFVLVDEYQDTNYAQHCIVWQLTKERQRVCVVGDDAQSIYSFRGANIDNILRFQSMYRDARLFKLERNYRSTQTIVNAANSLIAHNRGQIHKEVYSEKSEGQHIYVYNLQSDYEESIVVAQRIKKLHDRDHVSYQDIAILYRTNSQSRSLEEEIRKQNIPYKIYGGLSFYQRKEIKDIIAYLRLVQNPRDEEALKRIINYPARGIGNTTVTKLLVCASQHSVSPWQILMTPEPYQLDVNKGTASKLSAFAEKIMKFHAQTETDDAYKLTHAILQEMGVSADINKGTEPDDLSRQENLQEMLDSIASWVEENRESGRGVMLGDYLQEVALISDMDENDDAADAVDENDKITLMTVHSAKGLEFRVVFVVGLEEELFPNQMALQDGQRGLEEERRLMYVAMTRAEEQLYLTHAKSRFRFGKTETSHPSRFIREIDSRFLNMGFGTNPKSVSPSPKAPWEDRDTSWGNRTSGSGSRQTSGSQMPPSVWGKTLKRVSSLPKEQPSTPQSGLPGSSLRSPIPSSSTAGNYGSSTVGNYGSSTTAGNHASSSSVGNHASSSSGNVASPASSSTSSLGQQSMQVGSIVQHSRFGRGTVIKMEGTGLDTKAMVNFDNVGPKQLLLRFAKIEVIG